MQSVELRWWLGAIERRGLHRQDAFRQPLGLLHLPLTHGWSGRPRRRHKDDGIGADNECAEASFPSFALMNCVAINGNLEPAVVIEPGNQLVGKRHVGTRVRNEDLTVSG